jgi:predicted dehydrogenase
VLGIIGSGFGLYGYLPAVVKNSDEKVALLSKAKLIFKNRPELQFCEPNIIWFDYEEYFFHSIETVIFSVPPKIQMEYIRNLVSFENIKTVILEKPIGITPMDSDDVLNLLVGYKKRVRVGYIFQYTQWAEQLKQKIDSGRMIGRKIKIDWYFKAHHYKNNLCNWKRYESSGGSVLRFYGIQLLALISQLGYEEPVSSQTTMHSSDDYYRWEAVFMQNQLPTLEITINSDSEETFFNIDFISDKESGKISLIDPFSRNNNNEVDKRSDILVRLLKDLGNDTQDIVSYNNYFRVNSLWKDVENINLKLAGKAL